MFFSNSLNFIEEIVLINNNIRIKISINFVNRIDKKNKKQEFVLKDILKSQVTVPVKELIQLV